MARRDEVLEAAIELLDEVGLDGLTTRRLAARLGVQAGALYRHYPSKQALLDAMAGHLAGAAPLGVDAAADGPAALLRQAAIGAREGMLSHRDGARLLATFSTPPAGAAAGFDMLTNALVAAGASHDKATIAVDTVFAYVNGFTIEEQARKIGTAPGTRAWPRELRDAAFLGGLDMLITGIEATLKAG